jgi:2-oxoglutarate ferredoxin oxidoreductase subunit gamma
MEIKFSGFGGQGIIRMGLILGKAASIYDNKSATLTQSFGPEARGGACSAQLIVSDAEILYPYLTTPEVLVAMSQEAYDRFEPGLRTNGVLLTEQDLVRAHPPRGNIRAYSVTATRIAEQMGNRMFANMVMLGFMAAIIKVVGRNSLHKALPGMVPERSIAKNLEAMDRGWELGLEQLGLPSADADSGSPD